MKIEFVASPGAAEILAVLAHEGRALAGAGSALDQAASGALAKAMKNSRFTGAANSSLNVAAPAGIDANAVLLVGAGAADKLDDLAVETAAAAAYQATKLSGAEVLTIDVSHLSPELAARAGFAVRLAAYRFAKYLTKQKAEKIPSVTTVRVVTSDVKAAEAAFAPLSAVADAVLFSRDLVSEPANILYPAEFARRVKELEALGAKVEILGEAEMEKLGMGSLLGVGMGSVRESQLAVIQWNGGKAGEAPIAFVGKGVCFDTGGISLKPADGMEEMKWDMGGAAAVAGLMHALAGRKAKVNVVGVLGLVENMPDGAAQRPGDVVTSMSGQTIEVLNTDAEGRLILADAIVRACEDNPDYLIETSTLTGAQTVALGARTPGVMGSDEFRDRVARISQAVGENGWPMPLPDELKDDLKSTVADLANVSGQRFAGMLVAGVFLREFVADGVAWAHIDIAGPAYNTAGAWGYTVKGGTGVPTRTMFAVLEDIAANG